MAAWCHRLPARHSRLAQSRLARAFAQPARLPGGLLSSHHAPTKAKQIQGGLMACEQGQSVEHSDLEGRPTVGPPAASPWPAPSAEKRTGLSSDGHGLQRALRAAGIGYLDLQLPTGNRFYTDECLTVMGYGPQDREVFQRGWVPLIHPDDVAIYRENRRRAFSGQIDRFEEEIRRMRRDGTFGWLRCVGEVIERDSQGQTLRLVATIEDVDARHRAEDDLRRARQEIQALSAHIESHLEAERKLIASDVHDQCGQVLTVLCMELAALRADVQPSDPQAARVERLQAVTNELVRMSRDLITRLRPPALDLGLVPALEWLTQDWERQTGLVCQFWSVLEDLPLPDEVVTTLFRVVQECLTNATRHAQASRVRVDLAVQRASLELRVADDGRGFDVKADPAGHFGLLGMRERAQRVGARLELHSQRGRGTEVRVCLPLAPAAQWGPPDQAGAAHGRSA